LTFLEWDEPKTGEFGNDVKIVLVSANFSKEITTSVLWLNERELDIRCVRLIPYQLMGKTLLDIQQVLPLPEATDYQIRLRKKASEERNARDSTVDWTKYDLTIGGQKYYKLTKRMLFLTIVRTLAQQGKSVAEIQDILPERKFISLPGKVAGNAFRLTLSEMKKPSGAGYDTRRYYLDDEDLFFSDGKTWALSNQWSIKYIPKLEQLIERYPEAKISVHIASQGSE
jgi:hypothetical protein